MAAVTLLQKWLLLQVIVADAALSQTAKLVAARLLYHHSAQTGRCCPSYQTIADGVALKRRAVINAVQELESGGWITINQVKGGAAAGPNRYATNTFQIDFARIDRPGSTVHEDAPSTVHQDALLPDDNSAPPCTPPVHDGAPSTVHGGAPYSGKGTGKGNREESPPTPSDFDQFWKAYPRRVGKEDSHKAFGHVIRDGKATSEELIAGAERFAIERTGEPSKYTPHPATWLRRGQWTDEPARNGNFHNASSSGRNYSATRDWLQSKVDHDE